MPSRRMRAGTKCMKAAGGFDGAKVLDLGTGSGAVALALQHERPTCQVTAVDASADALAVASANAQRLGLPVQCVLSHWMDAVPGPFELIVSNPPYVADGDPHLADLTHEPLSALTSGTDGLDDIRQIIAQAPSRLTPGGWLLLEHGWDQAQAVQALGWEANGHGRLHLHGLPALPQPGFDELLWACDLNFVRGEDSLVRALWAGQAFIWHIYPQDDNAHHAKLEAFLNWMQAPQSLRRAHRVWNGMAFSDGPAFDLTALTDWNACSKAGQQRLFKQADLLSQLLTHSATTSAAP